MGVACCLAGAAAGCGGDEAEVPQGERPRGTPIERVVRDPGGFGAGLVEVRGTVGAVVDGGFVLGDDGKAIFVAVPSTFDAPGRGERVSVSGMVTQLKGSRAKTVKRAVAAKAGTLEEGLSNEIGRGTPVLNLRTLDGKPAG